MFVLLWGVPWLVDVIRRPARLTYFSRRVRTGLLQFPAGFIAARLHAWATTGAGLVVLVYVGLGWIAGMASAGSKRWFLAGGLVAIVAWLGTLRPFGMSLGLLRYEDDASMWKLSSIWSGTGPLNGRMLTAWGVGFAMRYVGVAFTAAAAFMITSTNDVVPIPIVGMDPIRDSSVPKTMWIVAFALGGQVVAWAGEWLRDLMLLIRRRGGLEAAAPRTEGPFVVLLRSFGDDERKVVARRLGPESFNILAAATPRRRRFLEDVIGWSLRSIGPIVAVADPRSVPTSGSSTAERVALGDEWRSVVQDLLGRAQIIVAIVGRTPGVRWELRQIAAQRAHPRTIFVFPPDDFGGLRARFTTLCDALGLEAPEIDPDGPPVVAAVVVGARVEVVLAGADEEIDYRAAVQHARRMLHV